VYFMMYYTISIQRQTDYTSWDHSQL